MSLCLFQLYSFVEGTDSSFRVTKLTTDIPLTLSRAQCSVDGVKLLNAFNLTHLFVRSQTNQSRIYYGYQDWNKGALSKFVALGDDKNHLKYDFDVVENTFVNVSETVHI